MEPSQWTLDQTPAMRMDLDYIPVEEEGQRLVLIRDPLGLVPQGVAIPEPVFALMTLMDGKQSVSQIVAEVVKAQADAGVEQGFEAEGFLVMIQELDQACLLASDHFRDSYRALRQNYAGLDERPMLLAGSSYPAQASACGLWVDECLETARSQGLLSAQDSRLKGLVAPHLEPSVCSQAYGSAYGSIGEQVPERVLVLGVGHGMSDALFSVGDKPYATPLGLLPSDAEWCGRLRAALPGLVSDDDFDHRNEHSIEFQAVFLRKLFENAEIQAIPVLCGSVAMFGHMGREGYLKLAGPVLKEMQKLAAMESTLVVAGIDLSHLGPKFGHEENGASLESQAREHEEALLAACIERDPDALWKEMLRVEDRYNVCGFSALACLLEILPTCSARTLVHSIWHEQATDSAVSYAAMSFSM